MESIVRFFDAYNREARVFPATLMLVPVLVLVLVAFPKSLLGEFPQSAFVVLAFLAVAYLIAGVARSAGKKAEAHLVDGWGGWPSTTMLRHTDAKIDSVTKARYHRALSKMCPEIAWPSPDDEAANANDADIKYGSAVAVLRERRRGEVHALVQKENASYGFRRNMLGLRPLAIVIAVLAALGACALLVTQLLHVGSASARLAKVAADPRWALLLIADATIAIAWVACVRPSWVRPAADDYAHALLRSLDAASS